MWVKILIKCGKHMASFLSILKSAWGGFQKAEPVIGTALSALNPAAGAIFNTVTTAINGAETFFSTPKSGAQKSSFVVQNFEQGLAVAQEIFAARGENLTYDPKALQAFIDSQVAAMNALSNLTGSIKTAPVAAPTGATGATSQVPLPAPVQTQPSPSLNQASTFLDPTTAKIIGL
jgi:hypothetical protein